MRHNAPYGVYRVTYRSDKDVDVQLLDKLSGVEIIAEPKGILSGTNYKCAPYEGVEYCYSGYWGAKEKGQSDRTRERGHEYIIINGVTNRDLVMKAYAYEAGDAKVDYSYEAPANCVDTGEPLPPPTSTPPHLAHPHPLVL